MNYDVIGDVHGHCAQLIQLLGRLGYEQRGGSWRKSGHQAIFVGDFIDRGPHQVETVGLVRKMVDAGHALAIMGNHEFNAIPWSMPDPQSDGDYLRTQRGSLGTKNRHQHQRFLEEVEGRPEHAEIIDWFLTLPLWLDLPGLRVVHACWSQAEQRTLEGRLAPGRRLTPDLVAAASRPGSEEYQAVECLLKGLEIPLPDGVSFDDKDGFKRTQVRIRWWDRELTTYRAAAMVPDSEVQATLPETPIPSHVQIGYGDSKPVFFGHYWFKGPPRILAGNAACVDYSVAKMGPLVAYRWSGEQVLSDEHFLMSDPSL